MKTKRGYLSGIVVFHHWKNKNYAIFNSLKKVIRIATLSFCYSLLIKSPPVEAQPDTSLAVSEESEIEEVIIEGEYITPENETIQSTTIITHQEIKSSSCKSLQEILEHTAGIDIRQRGANGIQADISLAGGTFDQYLLLLNGINMTNPQTGHYNLNLPINPSDIEKIEILYGNSASIHTAGAFCGAINIITKKPSSNQAASTITVGENKLFDAYLGGNLIMNSNINKLSLQHAQSDGYTKNTDYSRYGIFYQFNTALKNTKINIQTGYQDKKFGANSFYSSKYPEQYDKNNAIFGSIKMETGNRLKIYPSFLWKSHKDHFMLFRNNPERYQNYHLTEVYNPNILFSKKNLPGNLKMGIDIRYEKIYSNNLGEKMDSFKKIIGANSSLYNKTADRYIINQYTNLFFKWKLLKISNGLTINYFSEEDNLTFYPAIEATYFLKKNLSVYIAGERTYRIPTFTDLYYESPSNIGNSKLKPEEAWTYRAGIKHSHTGYHIHSNIYRRYGRNIIDWIMYDNIWYTENITKLTTNGIDILFGIYPEKINSSLSMINYIRFSYAFITKDKNSEDYISHYALDHLKHKASSHVQFNIMKYINNSWTLSYQERAGSYSLYDKSMETFINQDYKTVLLVDTKLSWTKPSYEIFISVTNLFNEQYRDLGSILQAGRWIKVGLSLLLK